MDAVGIKSNDWILGDAGFSESAKMGRKRRRDAVRHHFCGIISRFDFIFERRGEIMALSFSRNEPVVFFSLLIDQSISLLMAGSSLTLSSSTNLCSSLLLKQ